MAFKREGHHSVKPAWRRGTHKPEGRMIGIEFEIEHEDGFQYILDHLPEPREEKNRPVTERDGSLNENNGVEIVFPPYKNAAFKSDKSYFAKCMKSLEAIGVEAHFECGMHMNVNTQGWTAGQRGLFVLFFHWMDPQCLANIGGRDIEDHDYCGQEEHMDLETAMGWDVHSTVAGLRPNRIEVRFPRATTDMTKVKNLTNFMELVEDFVKTDGTYAFFEGLNDDEDLYEPYHYHEPVRRKFYEFLDNNRARPRTCATIKQVLSDGY